MLIAYSEAVREQKRVQAALPRVSRHGLDSDYHAVCCNGTGPMATKV
eukprot:SAG22_NODE_1960_length_3248_cov_2.405208_3_plen_47_part_00